MSNPPQDIPASQLWAVLSSQERPSKVVDFPRRDILGNPVGQLRIRILTQEEQMFAAVSAEKTVKEYLKENSKKDELAYERLFADALCIEVLYRACRDVDDIKHSAFPSPKHLRQMLTTEECGMLFQHYLTVQLELGPTVSHLSDEELEAWISRLAEGGSAFPFDSLSSDLQKILLLYMAYQLRSSQMDKSSATSPPDEPITSPNQDEESPDAT